jgi:hypothetical protein
VIWGNGGGDYCLSGMDGRPGDEVLGGPGRDTADRDAGDSVVGIERLVPYLCYGE